MNMSASHMYIQVVNDKRNRDFLDKIEQIHDDRDWICLVHFECHCNIEPSIDASTLSRLHLTVSTETFQNIRAVKIHTQPKYTRTFFLTYLKVVAQCAYTVHAESVLSHCRLCYLFTGREKNKWNKCDDWRFAQWDDDQTHSGLIVNHWQ